MQAEIIFRRMSAIECGFDLSKLPVQMDYEQWQQLCDSLAETAELQRQQLVDLTPIPLKPQLKSARAGSTTEEEKE